MTAAIRRFSHSRTRWWAPERPRGPLGANFGLVSGRTKTRGILFLLEGVVAVFSTHRSLVTSCCQRLALHKAPHTDRVACHVLLPEASASQGASRGSLVTSCCQRPALHKAPHADRLSRLAAKGQHFTRRLTRLVTSCCQRPALHKAPHQRSQARCPLVRLVAMTLRCV